MVNESVGARVKEEMVEREGEEKVSEERLVGGVAGAAEVDVFITALHTVTCQEIRLCLNESQRELIPCIPVLLNKFMGWVTSQDRVHFIPHSITLAIA